MSRPGAVTLIRDTIIFAVGVGITIGQTGFPYLLEAPDQGPSIPALVVGALFCNGPVVIQALQARFGGGTSSSGQSPEQQGLRSPSAPSSGPSLGGDQ